MNRYPRDYDRAPRNINFSGRHVVGAAAAWQLPQLILAAVVAASAGAFGLMILLTFLSVASGVKEQAPVTKLRSTYYDQCYNRLRLQGASTYAAFERCLSASKAAIPD